MTVETFGVKPTGFLASWRYVNVNVSEDGLVTNSNVPGKPIVNLDFVSDYRTNNRLYANDELITTFCNLDTFTRINVYAQDERPFAYVTTGLNDPTCGYEAPLPEPAVPYNPFGNPAFGLYKTFDYCNRDGVEISVEIEKKEYEGEVTVIEIGDKEPVTISDKEVENKLDPIHARECILRFINGTDLMLQEFYTEDERTFRVTVRYDGEIEFRGYLIPDSCSEPFARVKHPVSIKCTDALGSLKTVTYPFPIGATFNLKQSFKDILCYCLAPLNLNLDITTVCNVYDVAMANTLNDDPLAQASINPLRLSDDNGKILTCYEVIRKVCEAWGMSVKQDNGKWNFYRSNELSQLVVRRRIYRYTGLFLSAENVSNNRIVSNSNSTDLIALSTPETEIEGAYKRVEVLSSFGKVPSILYNGDFEGWTGFNFNFWTRYGGIDITRVQRSIRNSVGAIILIQNFALRFNKRANPGKWLEHSVIPIQQGDTVKVTYRVGKTLEGVSSRPQRGVYFKMRIKVGEYYLFNRGGGNTYEWVKSLAYVINLIDNPFGDLNTYTFGFQIPEAPTTGSMVVQLYGFDNTLEFVEPYVADYTQLVVDDIAFTKTSQSSDNDITGTLNITDNLRMFTNKPERKEILFGDYKKRPLADQELDSLYAIFVGDAYSTGWQEFGISGQPVAFGMALAKAHMRAYQTPFVNWHGEIKVAKNAPKFNYMDVLTFDTPDDPTFSGKRFIFLGGDYNMQSNQITNIKLAEVFDNTMVSVDNTVDYYPNAPEPIFIQDSNYKKVNGIFTDEFTQEFN